jgi:hypothetical protein
MKKILPNIETYNKSHAPLDQKICTLLMQTIDTGLSFTERKIWHAHPVWFINENPIVGYSKIKNGVRLMFWSGVGFDEKDLQPGTGKFKDASILYTSSKQIDTKKLKRWLKKSEKIQWDYKNIYKRKGKLLPLQISRVTAKAKQTNAPEKKHRIYTVSVASVYPYYIAKAEKKGRTKKEVDEIIRWLTGYSQKQFELALKKQTNFEMFFADAPRLNPLRSLITGVICGVKLAEIKDPLMREIRYLDKLIDELAKGRPMEKILRSSENVGVNGK